MWQIFNKKRCRRCGSLKVPILYGFPSPKMLEMVAEGRAKLGGCFIEPKKFACLNCDQEQDPEDIKR